MSKGLYLAFLALCSVGSLAHQRSGKLGIYNGKATTIESFPYIVAIYEKDVFLCAGTIISDHWVITTANCINETSDVSNLGVLAGSNDTIIGTYYVVNKIVQHPDYNSESYDYVYSLLQINGDFTWSASVKAALLPTSNPCSFSSVSAVGYGATTSSISEPGQLREGTMRWWPKSICKNLMFSSKITFTDRMACGYNGGKTTLCTGDLADPFVKDGVLYGMFAYAESSMACTSSASPVILAEILPVANWINAVTQASFEENQLE